MVAMVMGLWRWPLGSKMVMSGGYLKLILCTPFWCGRPLSAFCSLFWIFIPFGTSPAFYKYPQQKTNCGKSRSRWTPMKFLQVSGMVHMKQRPGPLLIKTLCDLIVAHYQWFSAVRHHDFRHLQCTWGLMWETMSSAAMVRSMLRPTLFLLCFWYILQKTMH